MTAGTFSGPVAEFYARFRRGYPPAVIDRLAAALGLHDRSRVLDIGCGTGQLTLPLAARTRAVLGVDVEPDMLRLARRAARDVGTANTTWMLAAGAARETFERQLRAALGNAETFHEDVSVSLLVGRSRAR